MRLMKLARPHMAARGGGTIFNFCSSAGIRWDMSGYGAYGAVKQAIRALTRAAAAEWGSEGIRVLTIAPHAASPGLMWWIENNPEEAEAFFRTIPLGRVGELEQDIGRALVALCGQDLAYLTGATIPLDGGQANFD
jgi:NAD(P)-dependent dehydrogenase (short-subunit alcohol dehydrogenase family)